jgi:hypothetical protein
MLPFPLMLTQKEDKNILFGIKIVDVKTIKINIAHSVKKDRIAGTITLLSGEMMNGNQLISVPTEHVSLKVNKILERGGMKIEFFR